MVVYLRGKNKEIERLIAAAGQRNVTIGDDEKPPVELEFGHSPSFRYML
jgi:hypothetical protein